ncbi:MAG TPA: DUF4386 domain-containing protein [Coriobacteriia bacterium]|nr:DUF4386 domain-containing protein [Coriobacteriia bacterium]
MKNERAAAIWVGILYIIGTAAGVGSLFFSSRVAAGAGLLKSVAENVAGVQITGLLVLTMGIALAAIPAIIYPTLKRYSEPLAVGYVIFRGALETLTHIGVAVCWFFLPMIAAQSTTAGAAASAQLASLGALAMQAPDAIGAVGSVVFSISALILYTVMYRARLVPRWLAGWGLVSAVLYLAGGVITMFAPMPLLLMMPMAFQEMVMAVWLIVKGFGPGEVSPKASSLQPMAA